MCLECVGAEGICPGKAGTEGSLPAALQPFGAKLQQRCLLACVCTHPCRMSPLVDPAQHHLPWQLHQPCHPHLYVKVAFPFCCGMHDHCMMT